MKEILPLLNSYKFPEVIHQMIGEPQGCLPGQGVLFVDIEARLAINVAKGKFLK